MFGEFSISCNELISSKNFTKKREVYNTYDNNHARVVIQPIALLADNDLGLLYEMKIIFKTGSHSFHIDGYYRGVFSNNEGNEYTMSNLNIVGHTYSGLFSIIGDNSEMADLKLYNVKVSTNITNDEKSTSEFYDGMIVGKNNGVIKYCLFNNNGTSTQKEIQI
jgi:hypothetical protein